MTNPKQNNQTVSSEYIETVIRMVEEGVHDVYSREDVVTLLQTLTTKRRERLA